MSPQRAMSKLTSEIRWVPVFGFLGNSRVIAILAVALALVASSRCSAQTLSLGTAGQYSVFEVAGSSGNLSVTGSTINGNIGLGSGTSHSFTNSTINGTVTNPAAAQASTDAINASSTASGLKATGTMSGNQINLTNGSVTFTGQAGQNVVDLSKVNLTNSTFTISGTSSETFIFNVSGAISLTNSYITLSGGVTANHIIFNVTGTGNSVSLTNSTDNGTFLDLKGAISVTNGSETGAFMSESNISLTNDPLNGSPFSSPAPELPTIMMAGIACLCLLGKAGIDYRRGRTRIASVPFQP